jgi:hypothetical protein
MAGETKLSPSRLISGAITLLVAGAILTMALVTAFAPTHLEKVNVTDLVAGTPTASGIPVPITDDIVVANTEKYEPHFPFSDFRDARDYAKGSAFQIMVRQKLPPGTYRVSVSNTLTKLLLPLEKVAPDIYVSPNLIILDRDTNTTYFLGYNVLRQDAGTQDSLQIEVDRVVPGRK